MSLEIYRKIPGYNRYLVSSWGYVYRIDEAEQVFNFSQEEGEYVVGTRKLTRLNAEETSKGYLRVDLYKEGRHKHYKVHRLVANAFIPNPENKPQVNHKDGNKQNNSITNLEWVTDKENKEHNRTLADM